MATPVIMPRQGQSVESCIITEWMKKVGDTVSVGDVLFSYETDKSTFEEEAKIDGTLLAVFYNSDDDVPVLMNVAVIGNPGESFAEFAPDGAVTAAPAAVEAKVAPVAETAPAVQATAARAEGVSPRAKNAAEKLGVNPAEAAPTGPHGRVIERDVLALAKENRFGGDAVSHSAITTPVAAKTAEAPAVLNATEYDEVKLPNLRRVIAKTMHDSLAEMAQLTHSTTFDATKMLTFRESLKTAPESMELPKITINDIILFAVSRVLTKHEGLNAHMLGDKMRFFKHVNLGIAVDTPRGLLVPTLYAAETKSLGQIAAETKTLAKSAIDGSINPDLLQGGTFTISNLGLFGIESFTPVINPPQVALLGVCAITERIRTADGQITAYPAMGLSLTYDHRAVDGAPASRFLKDLVTALEHFDLLLIG
ncbi:MAG TPA: 2-oxo acid dehydrogenase subunit E2 [Clostridiales bacterium]|jgi:pyruvate dehydrogenase E2 component (dihydrolipoamide acetyltransferase)|nr:2-oxo acid dehydrogenase subunit E2 [Clostridiales bacterium]